MGAVDMVREARRDVCWRERGASVSWQRRRESIDYGHAGGLASVVL